MTGRWVSVLAIAGALAMAPAASGVETRVVQDGTFAEFNQGESTGTELLGTGRLRLAPRAARLALSDEAVAWKAVADPFDNHVFFSTGHNGKVFGWKPGGKVELWADLAEVEALSLAVDSTGALLVGASPGGKIYRVVQPGKPEILFDTKEQYVWDMIFDRDGLLYAATGPNGKIFRVRGPNNGEVYYDSDAATNIMALGFDREGKLIAATQGKAFVLRITGAAQAYVLYAAKDDEIRALATDPRGNIYAAVNGSRAQTALDQIEKDAKSVVPGMAVPPRPPDPGMQSSIIQIQPSGFAATFWQSPEGPIQALLADPASPTVFVAAGRKGRIYRLLSDTNWSVVADVEEPMVLSLATLKGRVYFTTANRAALYELGDTASPREGLFASRALNGGTTVRWGNLFAEADVPPGASLAFETRTGNTSDPDDRSWSAWKSAPVAGPSIYRVESPVAQYLQYRLTLKPAPDGGSPLLDKVQFFYVQQNAAPVIREIRVEKVGGEAAPAAAGGQADAVARMLSAARATPATPGAPPAGGEAADPMAAIRARLALAAGQKPEDTAGAGSGMQANSKSFRVSWDASDPNGDKLAYNIYLKAEDEEVWKLVEENTDQSRIGFTTDDMADGRYRFKIEAGDFRSNDRASATSATLVSQSFVADNTPPVIRNLKSVSVGRGEWEVTGEAEDALSIVAAAVYDLDAQGKPLGVAPEDGVFDFTRETFRFRVRPEKPAAEHSVALRVYDREGNSSVAKVLLK